MSTKWMPYNDSGVAIREYSVSKTDEHVQLWPSVGEYGIYDDLLYYIMTDDKIRCRRYRDAIAPLVQGRVVVDIGTGQDLNWALACLEMGAEKIYAIEEMELSCNVAKAFVKKHRLENRIIVIHGTSTSVSLPQRADICVSEIIGSIGGSEGAATVLQDALKRHLSASGQMIPVRCETRIGAIELPQEIYDEPAFNSIQAGYVKKIFDRVGHPFDIRLCLSKISMENLLSTNEIVENLSFTRQMETATDNAIQIGIHRPGRLDGFVLWIRLWCAEDLPAIDSLKDRTSWLPVLFPVFSPGVAVKQGDEIDLIFEEKLSDNGLLPDYRLCGELRVNGVRRRFAFESPHHGRVFRQNAFYRKLFALSKDS